MSLKKCSKTGKSIFPSKVDALLKLLAIKNSDWWKGGYKESPSKIRPVRTYQCEFCNGWHLTHLTEKEWLKKGFNDADKT